MQKGSYFLKSILLFLLILPIILGFNHEFLFIREINLYIILITISGIIFLILLGKFIEIYGFNQELMEIMKDHDVINAFRKREFKMLFFWFPITIIMEELIFRLYLATFLLSLFDVFFVLIIASFIFGSYHVHILYSLKNKRITLIFVGYSYILGLFLNFILLTIGILFCIVLHYLLVIFTYYNLYKRYIFQIFQENEL